MSKLLLNLSNVTKINWIIRVKNPVWWAQVIISFFVPIFVYYGISGESMDSWAKLFALIHNAISNPFVLATAIISAVTTSIDSTSTGVSDSSTARDYVEPNNL